MKHPKIALLSDIHANPEALRAVMYDLFPMNKSARADRIWCLGDVLGYGHDPLSVLHIVLGLEQWPAFDLILGGNHDGFFSGQWGDPRYFNSHGLFALLVQEGLLMEAQSWPTGYDGEATTPYSWVRQAFGSGSFDLATHSLGKVQLMARHSMLNSDLALAFRYVFPWRLDYLGELFTSLEPQVTRRKPYLTYFFGHSHVPLFVSRDNQEFAFHDLRFNQPQQLPRGVSIINPGSVGQPRGVDDGYRVAPTYVILDPNEATVEFRRVPYLLDAGNFYKLEEASTRFPGVAFQFQIEPADWPDYARSMIQKLLALFNNDRPPTGWEQMERLYSYQPWGWQGVRIPTTLLGGGS